MADSQSKGKTGKRALAVTVVLVIVAAGVLSAFNIRSSSGGGNTQSGQQTQTAYRETKVERGDIVVGANETATATLKTRNIFSEISAKVLEVYVKPGEYVKEGDPLIKISVEDVQEQIDTLERDYRKAQLDYNQAKLDHQQGLLKARETFDTTVTKSGSAEAVYKLTLERLELDLINAKNAVADLQREISSYTRMLRYVTGDNAEYTDIQLAYERAEKELTEIKQQLRATPTDAPNYEGLQLMYQEAQNDRDLLYASYQQIGRDYTSEYGDLNDEDQIKDRRKTARDKLITAQNALTEAENNLALKKLEAEQTRKSSVNGAENADSIYHLTIQQLENTMALKEITVAEAKKKIDDTKDFLKNAVLTAPCNGRIASVSCVEGDKIQAESTLAVLSDTDNVLVYTSVAQDDIAHIELGQEAAVTLNAFDTVTFVGEVDSIATSPARSATGSANYTVTVKIEGDVSKVFEGMTGSVTLITRQQKNVLFVSNRCVYSRDGVSYVKVKDDAGEISEVQVTTGFSNGRNVEVVTGLEEGQTVLIESQVVGGA